jgi:hypothetical protein
MPNIAQKILEAVIAPLVGLVVLIPFCLARAWEPCWSSKGPYPVHAIDCWKWAPLNKFYGNPEDGVSGKYALIWKGNVRVPYMPNAWPPWRAYCWSAWRNTADQLKYTYKD